MITFGTNIEAMLRYVFIVLISTLVALPSFAQEEKTTTVVKAGTVEMKAVDERPASVIILSPATATGDMDTPASHPECAEWKGQEGLDCTAVEVKKMLREKMGEPALDMAQWGTSPVSINFAINQFGEVKDIRVEHSGDQELSRQVIIALYDLPRFNPATKAEKAVNSNMQVNYRYEELYKAR